MTLQPLFASLGDFDTVPYSGLSDLWVGRVFIDNDDPQWLAKMAEHDDGIALVSAKTTSLWFHDWVFNKASGILFLRGKIKRRACCLVSYDGVARFVKDHIAEPQYTPNYDILAKSIADCNLEGKLVRLNEKKWF